ncbi:heterokaryon incompatibility, partial [Cucurbitaria berberidis CBS 394.84]
MIHCELIIVSLEDVAGDFAALSYVWGSPSNRERITVNGTDVPATMNLEAALRRVRNTEKVELLWVDAICINQTDIVEKNIQVMRMKEIYTKSARVLVWIGD